MNTILLTDIENSEDLGILEGEISLGPWLEDNGYSIVSLDADPEGEFGYLANVAKDEDDLVPVLVDGIDLGNQTLDLERAMKLEIALELEELEEDSSEDMPIAAFVNPTAFTPPITTNTNSGAKMKAHEYLAQLITNNPGISRTAVFTNVALRSRFLSKAVITLVATGDKLETKRYNRRLNRFIRQIRRDGTDISIERIGRVAHYSLSAGTQLEIPFDLKTEARNSLVIGNNFDNEELEAASSVNFRADEDANVNLSFEDLLSTLDDEAVASVAK